MKKFLVCMLMMVWCVVSNASSHHIYFEMRNDGTLVNSHYSDTHNNYSVDVLNFVISENGYFGITILFTGIPAEYETFRLHANGEHYTLDETDPLWNMELQPTINPRWCSYSYDNGEIRFTDTFEGEILREELSTVNTVRYRIYDRTNNHDYTIQFNNAFAPMDNGIITGICDVFTRGPEIKYYDLNGRVSTVPFDGLNIVIENGVACKKIY